LEAKKNIQRQDGGPVQNNPGDIAGIFSRHVKTVYRLCYSYLASPQDAEDATQAVFMKLVAKPRTFEDVEHEKAWLLVVAANYCKDVLKSAERARAAEMPPDVADPSAKSEPNDVLEAVLALPPLYKDCVYLYYYEGYKTDEIAKMTETPPSTIRNRLRDARALLKTALEGE
jgi:RNA polymerase sigma-70 factor (ECF subfamily)